jgi:hypothetical protein
VVARRAPAAPGGRRAHALAGARARAATSILSDS